MSRTFIILAAAWLLPCAHVAAQAPADPRPPQQVEDSTSIAALARALTIGSPSDSARAAVLYEWVARNVAYDLEGYFTGRVQSAGAEDVFRRRIAVCGGYVALYTRMAAEAGLEARPVEGFAKGFDYAPGHGTARANHAWVAVRIGSDWRLIDPTWGSGYVQERRFHPEFTWDYFFVDPDALLLSHYPDDPSWQLVSSPVRRGEFERLPAVPRTLVQVGFAPGEIRTAALRSRQRDFPLVGSVPAVRVIRAPLAGTLRRGARVEVDVEWPGASAVALVVDGKWTRLQRKGERFSGEAKAAGESVSVVGHVGGGSTYATLLHYRVQ